MDTKLILSALMLAALAAACGSSSSDGGLRASEIPVAHTPPGGYQTFPPLVLGGCTEPLAPGAPALRGMWDTVEVNGTPPPVGHPLYGHFERIEQCGNRIAITSGGVIHDMVCDGTFENGVHDVAARDFTTPIDVVCTFENGVHVLRPVLAPGVEVTRRLDGDVLVWNYLNGYVSRLVRLGPPESAPPR